MASMGYSYAIIDRNATQSVTPSMASNQESPSTKPSNDMFCPPILEVVATTQTEQVQEVNLGDLDLMAPPCVGKI